MNLKGAWILNGVEGGLLLAAAPLLLFPTLLPWGTALVLILMVGTWGGRWIVERRLMPVTPFNGILVVWCLAVLAGTLVTLFPDLTLPKVTGLILGLAWWRYLALVLDDGRYWRWGVVGFLCLGGIVALIGALAVRWPTKVPYLIERLPPLPGALITLPEAPMSGVHPNELAGALTLYLPLPLSLALGWRGRLRHLPLLILWILGSLFGGMLLVLTQSRSGWLGGLAGIGSALALWGGILPRSWRKWALWLFLAGLIVLMGMFIGPHRWDDFWAGPAEVTATIGPVGTFKFRVEVWRQAIQAIQDFPLTGCGLGTFRRMARVLYPLDPAFVSPDYDIAHAHNIFLQTALDVGIPGLIAYLALLMVAGAVCWNAARRGDPLTRSVAIGLAAGLLAFHVYGMTDALAMGSKPSFLLWYALGLVAALYRVDRGLSLASRPLS